MRQTSCLAALVLLALAATPASAGSGVPTFDGSRDCGVATSLDQVDQRTAKDCIADERNARAELVRRWDKYPAAERTFCTRETEAGGPPSYVDLLVGLEIAKGNADDRSRMAAPARP